MQNGRKVETRRDRKALARDAGMGRLSILSVLAGALTALAAFEALVALAGAVVVAIHGSTNFGAAGLGALKTLIGITVALGLFVAFVLGGYVTGRMSRRRGATHGLSAGILGVVLAAIVVAAVGASGADNGLARVARHIQVAATWQEWRTFALLGAVVAAVAMVLGGLAGGIKGERWHGKLLARAVDPSFGPEAEERALARRKLRDAEVARLSSADHVGRLTAASRAAQTRPIPAVDAPAPAPATGTTTGPTTAVVGRATRRGPAPADPTLASPAVADEAAAERAAAADQTARDENPTGGRHRPRHLLGRR